MAYIRKLTVWLHWIPIDRNGKLRIRGIYSMKSIDAMNSSKDKHATERAEKANIDAGTTGDNKELFRSNYLNLVPKMSLSLDKGLEKNPRILDLREKLNEITKKQDRNVDKKTKGLINGITQLVDEKDQNESGPYSLLFDLQPATSTFKESTERDLLSTQSLKNSMISINKSAERLPNVINFDDKPMREFEYSCENQITYPVTKTFNTHSRSDLCLQLKSQIHTRIFDSNLSPNDNSLSRTNEENSLDDSLGILTPDQMDDICYLENAFSPTVEGLPIFCDNNESKVSPDYSDTPSTDKTESNSAVSTIQNDEFEKNDCTAPIMVKHIESNKKDIIVSKSCDNLSAQNISSTSVIPDIVTCDDKQNKIEEIDVVKAEFIPNMIDEEFMPSIHSSILEPVSSIAETTVNLELPLDCKHENRSVVQRIEQTPSPEDLPLDSSDINGEISTYSQFSSSTLHDSQTYSDNKNEYPKSMETSKVSNSFITSITSITSLDGYQGDGEMSRPVSRAADHSIEPREDAIEMEWQNVPVTRRADPMTDSDFFTESDADGLDDHMHRGDRKAQVIDGALYGGKSSNGNPPLIVNRNDDSCMESSGVYTDFENHRTSPVFLNVIDDMSPEGSTPSTHSECSQKNVSPGQINTYFTPIEESMNQDAPAATHVVDEDKTPKEASKRNSLNSEKDVRSTVKSKEEKRSFTLKKYKMPKRDVPSKLKTMLANRSTDADNSVQSSPKTVKKPERRESLTKKNTIDLKADYKMKSFKDIKSKVDCSFSLQRSQTACSVTRMLSSKSTNTNLKPKSGGQRQEQPPQFAERPQCHQLAPWQAPR
ncbi:hypothetical protein MSG28_006100 [Choristoneura fumiferana]|uniref:Uncharacterized protein n=1 Tax=Choristoneura fumiferana TaxID=7141 RepID=A0ACC0JDL1_CHOFU|nr:hypothetical protein MSG28_006100 [Choristoneura fumiferana]